MTDPTAAAAPQQKSSIFDDLVEITFAPAQVFARRVTSGFGTAFFILWILMSGVLFASRPVFEPVMQAEMAKAREKMAQQNPNLTADQAAIGEKVAGFIGVAIVFVSPPILMLVLGLLVWIVARMFGGAVNAGQGMLIGTLAYVPRFLGSVAVLALSFVTDSSKVTSAAQLTLSPARFMDPATSGLTVLSLVSRLDVTVLWGTAVIAIGYATIGKMEKGKAWGAAIALWVLGAVPVLLSALRS
jgi:hypothetical protein